MSNAEEEPRCGCSISSHDYVVIFEVFKLLINPPARGYRAGPVASGVQQLVEDTRDRRLPGCNLSRRLVFGLRHGHGILMIPTCSRKPAFKLSVLPHDTFLARDASVVLEHQAYLIVSAVWHRSTHHVCLPINSLCGALPLDWLLSTAAISSMLSLNSGGAYPRGWSDSRQGGRT